LKDGATIVRWSAAKVPFIYFKHTITQSTEENQNHFSHEIDDISTAKFKN
jgi:RES domain-containing protein